jgi:hypothetical protein
MIALCAIDVTHPFTQTCPGFSGGLGMKKLSVLLSLAGALLGSACADPAVSPASPSPSLSSRSVSAKPNADMAVTTIINDVDGAGLPSDILSDGAGNYVDGVNGVKSILMSNTCNRLTYGDWQLETYASTRAVGHALESEDAVQPGDPHFIVPANPPFWGTQVLKSKLQMTCTCGSNRSMLTMAAGTTMTCGMLNVFTTSDDAQYHMAAAQSFTGYDDTTDVQVGCNAVDSTGCKDWFIDPIDGGQAVARLVRHPTKPNQPKVILGDFYMRFHFHVTR